MTYSLIATEVTQGLLKFYSASVSVKDALSPKFYSVDQLDPRAGTGFQRVLDRGRARKIADYILDNIDNPEGVFIPTSIFLATEVDVPFDANNKRITIDQSALPFSVVDGQHRLEGFRMAAERDRRVLGFEVAINICPKMPLLHQMCHFYIVNTTQRKVDEAIGQRIIARLTQEHGMGEFPALPKWMQRLVEMGDIDDALKIAEYLNDEPDSPWFQKIIMANHTRRDGGIINQKSFVKAIKQNFVTAANPISVEFDGDKEKQCRAIKNYWLGIANCIQPEEDSVFFKTNGLEIFSKLSIPFSMKLQERRDWSVMGVENLFTHLSENVEGDYAAVTHSEWWKRGGPSSSINAAGRKPIIDALTRAIHANPQSEEVRL